MKSLRIAIISSACIVFSSFFFLFFLSISSQSDRVAAGQCVVTSTGKKVVKEFLWFAESSSCAHLVPLPPARGKNERSFKRSVPQASAGGS